VLFTVALTYATDRFRASAETALAVLAGVAVDALWNRLRAPRVIQSAPPQRSSA